MKFIEFLLQAQKKSFWKDLYTDSSRVICFRGDLYPLLFFRLFAEILKEKEVITITPFRAENSLELWKTLQQSFLGAQSFYWLGNITQTLKKNKRSTARGGAASGGGGDVVEVLSLYKGPHAVAFFIPSDYKLSVSAKKRMLVIDVENFFSFRDVENIFSFFGVTLKDRKRAVMQQVAKHASLDLLCMFIYYFSVTHIRLIDSLEKNLASLVEPELSLYDLSRSFFSQQKKNFFFLWADRWHQYTMPFWVAYWSEQLWRAYHVVKFLKQGNFPAARRFAFRLPDSFLKSDWRHCSLESLRAAYTMLYDVDFAFKKGSSFCSLDLLFSNYFLGNFEQKQRRL